MQTDQVESDKLSGELDKIISASIRLAGEFLQDEKIVRDMEVSGAAAIVMSGCPEEINSNIHDMVGEASVVASQVLGEKD